ncbi:aminodeoxychorismate lyase [Pistricoccus aurantiacus]|uniref:Aminodeoxychorismate lyase n=1 Tax=Pistricoccus aurantiacus TaxID=1883414 RepID=A0A5B8SUW7_9GAMM|nr:aminodeoxychorismate lyase [Pistricoccus aurantiacus]QEA40151.1 aminodeoxychorismate lyase [Pistricoccus aurantiacus]
MRDGDRALPFDDRGLSYGDGLFETVLVRDGKPVLWEEHLARLEEGCRRLELTMPKPADLNGIFANIPLFQQPLAVLKLILTRGSGGRGYRPPWPSDCRLRYRLTPFSPDEERWHRGVRIRRCSLRLGIQPRLAGIKHLNRLENVLARSEWNDDAIAEGLLCDSDGRLVEATSMNLFWQRQGRLETPRLDRCGVAGTLRQALLDRLPIQEVNAGVAVLEEAEALWLGNSVQGIWPVIALNNIDGTGGLTWALNETHRHLQNHAHRLLGYPLIQSPQPGDATP